VTTDSTPGVGTDVRAPRDRLAAAALVRLVAGIAILAAVFFLPAGTTDWWQAWAYMAILFTAVTVMFAWLLVHDPALLERRMRGVERRSEQRLVQAAGSVVYVLVFLLPGLDRRFGWSHVPAAVSVAADLLVVAGYAGFAWVLRVNSWASRLVEVQQGQRVVTAGPYALVRHPMYSAILLMFFATPVALGSWWALIPAALLAPVLALRIRHEETLLARELAGYADYVRTTRWRLLPGLW
jgi:protein-S-isoprenylcysteine O-methyltransferase Ste14